MGLNECLCCRNVSSDGEYARRKLRDCDGFVDALFVVVRAAISNGDMDNKSVENCICILRNLSFACQEAIDPEYLQKRAANTGSKSQGLFYI
jgi:catenin delta-2